MVLYPPSLFGRWPVAEMVNGIGWAPGVGVVEVGICVGRCGGVIWRVHKQYGHVDRVICVRGLSWAQGAILLSLS